MVAPHIDELSGSARAIEGSFDDRLRQTDKRDHSAIGRQTRVDVQQCTAIGRRNRIGDRLDHLGQQVNRKTLDYRIQ